MTKQQESNTARAPFAQQLERMHICITRLAHHAREAGKADPVALGGLLSQITDTVAELEALDDEIQRRRDWTGSNRGCSTSR